VSDGATPTLRAFVFLGALLLFALEPLCGRLLVARFGGAFYVWTSALMFFQATLVAGYLYAHRVAPRLGRWHVALLLLGLALLPPAVGAAPPRAGAWEVVLALGLPVAVLAALLSATSVTAQRAALARDPAARVFSLYALSNAGSLVALALDAVVIAPALGLRAQVRLWSVVYAVFAVLALLALRGLPRTPRTDFVAPSPVALAGWTALSALTATALSGVTNQLTLDAGQVPLLWSVPLALYLGTFVVAFAGRVPATLRVIAPQIAAAGVWLCLGGDTGSPALQAGLHLGAFTAVTLAAHGALYDARPDARALGGYYLAVAVGGSLGGAFVALLAPRWFTGLWELPLSLVGMVLVMGVMRRDALRQWLHEAPRRDVLARAALPLFVLLRVVLGAGHDDGVTRLAVTRSPYGLYHVLQRGDVRELVSGTTRHGRQRLGDPQPLSYYHRAGSLGDTMNALATPEGARVLGVVGMGVGAAAAYLTPGDRGVFFEIDPAVVTLARAHFRYLPDARGALEVVTGDARAQLAARGDHFDLLLVDAFAGDAIPTHLVTREAVALSLSRLSPLGLLVFHISNRFYDLRPVLATAAQDLGLAGRWRERLQGLQPGEDPSRYVVLARDEALLRALDGRGWRTLRAAPDAPRWTDDHADPLALWRRGRRE
jgi:hypothetical protein